MPNENEKKPWETAEGFEKNIGVKQNSDTRYNNTTYVEQVDDTTGDKTWTEEQVDKPLKNTGQGVEAALGTQYSWQQQGAEKAKEQYSTDVLNTKQNIQENASTINQNLSQYQEQADMMQYQNNQQAEKVGWTGGYVLDQNRQMEYLKASLNAQMYGAIKLQEYGYDTSLAAARLSYDLNQKAYAQEYYNQAVTNALNEAQITGTYFSAETKDMMSQLAIATQIANDSSQSEADKDNAKKLQESIYAWFNTNGISTQGVDTLQAWQADQQNELNWQNEIWTEYQAALQTAQAAIDENATQYLMYGENDQLIYENGEVRTIDLAGLSEEDLKSYAKSNKGKEQITSFFKWKAEQIKIENTTYDSEGNIKTQDTEKITQQLEKLNEQLEGMTGNTLDVEGYKRQDDGSYTPTDKTLIEGTGNYSYIAATYNSDGTVSKTGTTINLIKDKSSISGLSGSDRDDDVDLDFGDGVGDGNKNYNYDIDVDWTYAVSNWDSTQWYATVVGIITGGLSVAVDAINGGISSNTYNEKAWDTVQRKLKEGYPTATDGSLVLAEDTVWIYYNGTWGYVQQTNAGGTRLKEDLNAYASGVTPSRWKK